MMKTLVSVAALSISLLAGCRTAPPSSQESTPVPAQVVVISPATQQNMVPITGTVSPQLASDIAAQITAPIRQVTKHEGDRIHRGEVLVRLSAPALQAGVAQAEAALAGAQRQQASAQVQSQLAADTLARYQKLRSQYSVTPHELDQVQAQSLAAQAQQQASIAEVAAARAALSAQQSNAADSILLAPFDGVVTRRLADPGAMVIPGSPILHVQSLGREEVDISVPENLIGSIRPGTSLAIAGPAGATQVHAKVSTLSPSGDIASHSFVVKALLPPGTTWNAGTTVNVFLPSPSSASAIAVPVSAIIEQGGLDAVLALNQDNRADVRYVSLGRRLGGTAEVLSGLHGGDRILLHGDLSLAGRVIEVRQ